MHRGNGVSSYKFVHLVTVMAAFFNDSVKGLSILMNTLVSKEWSQRISRDKASFHGDAKYFYPLACLVSYTSSF